LPRLYRPIVDACWSSNLLLFEMWNHAGTGVSWLAILPSGPSRSGPAQQTGPLQYRRQY